MMFQLLPTNQELRPQQDLLNHQLDPELLVSVHAVSRLDLLQDMQLLTEVLMPQNTDMALDTTLDIEAATMIAACEHRITLEVTDNFIHIHDALISIYSLYSRTIFAK